LKLKAAAMRSEKDYSKPKPFKVGGTVFFLKKYCQNTLKVSWQY
jgi:hypothetical protein